MEIKTIDVNALEWFDKVNGNSYFSATITLNFRMKEKREYFKYSQGYNVVQDKEQKINLPLQYGYGDHYMDMAKNELTKRAYILNKENHPLWRYCKDNNIILRNSIQRGCKKRELTH